MSIQRISQIHITTSDTNRAVSFYRDTLGLRFLFDVPEQKMAFFDVGGTRLYLGPAEGKEFESAPLLYFEVEDIDSEYASLVAAGVTVIGTPHLVHDTDEYALWMTFFETPDGHVNALSEHRVK